MSSDTDKKHHLQLSRASQHFSDVESFGQASGWDLGFRQLDPGAVDISASFLSSPVCQILKVSFNKGFHQKGVAPEGVLTFGAPRRGFRDWYDSPATPNPLINFNHRGGFDSVTDSCFEGYTFAFTEEYLEKSARNLGLAIPDWIYDPEPGRVVRESKSSHRVFCDLDALIGNRFGDEAEDAISELLVNFLIATVPEEAALKYPKGASRRRVISNALDYIESHCRDRIQISELCQQIGTSVRTLDRAFREKFGVTPKSYIRNRRLASVRGELLASKEDIKVTQIASDWGFTHLGQFSNDYRKLFGELPSETLHRR